MEHYSTADMTSGVSRPGVSTRRTRRVLAAALSSVVPGAGQLWLGKKRIGIGFLCAFCLLLLLYWPLRLARSYAGVQVLVWTTVGLCMAAAWHALRTPSQQTARGSRWWLVLLVPVALLASFAHSNWLLLAAGFRPFDVPSTGMEPTVLKGDRIVVDLREYRSFKPRPRDVVVFRKNGTFFLKRVVAVGGDTVEGKGGAIVVNRQRLEEPYIQHLGDAPVELNEFGPVQIPPGELFVTGDNRDVSKDSRMQEFGFVAEKSVAGKALYIIRSKWKRVGTDLR